MNKYKAGCLVVVAGLLTGCASQQVPCNCQPARTVYVPVPVKQVVKPKPVSEKPIIREQPERTDANGNAVTPLPPKKPSKLQKLRDDIKRLKDEYLRKKSGEPANPNEFRG